MIVIVVLKVLSFLKKGYVLVRGSTDYDIPTLPSRVGIRDVFYLDSLGRRFGRFSKKKSEENLTRSCIYIKTVFPSCQPPYLGFFAAALTFLSMCGLPVLGIAFALIGSNLLNLLDTFSPSTRSGCLPLIISGGGSLGNTGFTSG